MTWTDARIALLKELWPQGLSTTDIADAIGVSKNAVIGKAGRLGLGRHANANRWPTERQPRAEPRVRRGNTPKSSFTFGAGVESLPNKPFRPAPDPTKPRHIGLQELTNDTCRWPYGDSGYTFCGRTADENSPYCPEHRARAWVPQSSLNTRSKPARRA